MAVSAADTSVVGQVGGKAVFLVGVLDLWKVALKVAIWAEKTVLRKEYRMVILTVVKMERL